MISVFILRRDILDARRSQAAIEASRDLRVAGVADTLFKARMALAAAAPEILLADLRLGDGTVLGLLHELRSVLPDGAATRVMAVTQTSDDPLLFAALRGGVDSFVLEAEAGAAIAPSLTRLQRGEAAASASVARQLLGFFGAPVPATPPATAPAAERALDWNADAHNPLRLSRAEQHMLALLAHGESTGKVALRMGVSVEAVGRRIANVYRKLRWDLASGSLSLQAA